MTVQPQNPNWPLIAEQRPQLRQHISTYPQVYRGARWYILRDETSGRYLRFNEQAYALIGRLDGDLTLQEVCDQMDATLGEETLSQDEVLMILSQLSAIDALRNDLPADTRELFKRFQHDRRIRRQRAIMSPLSIRVPLLDPDRLLNRLMPWLRPMFSRAGAILWLLVVGFAGLLALVNFTSLASAMDQDILAPANLISMLLVFIIIKAIHEFAHAFTVKMWGGEVHEMGITFLVLAPIPYVDATAAWGFRDKYKRMLVGAVGILVEIFLSALALFVWLAVEPGLLRDAAFNAVLIGTVSTLLFNANPLLRFDGYYVLQDLVEIPNLYTRASRYYLYLIQRYLFGLENARSPVTAAGERSWFAAYGLGAFLYRMIIMVTIVLFLVEKYLFIGVALGVWSVTTQIVLPVFRSIRFLLAGPMLAGRRTRATAVSMVLVTGISSGLLLLPVPLTTQAEGIVWVSDNARVYADTDGFVTKVLVASDTYVDAGTALIQLRDSSLEAKLAKLEAKRRELEIRSAAELLEHRVQSGITKDGIVIVEAELSMLRKQIASLLVHSEVSGRFVIPDEQRLTGRYLLKGDLIGYLISPERLIVSAVVPQSDIGLLRKQVSQVEIRLAERLDKPMDVRIIRETPAGTSALPSRALGAAGGGNIAIRASDEGELTAAEKVFQVDLSLPEDLKITGVGERAYVRFDHGAEPLASQWLRSGRQLVLSRLNY